MAAPVDCRRPLAYARRLVLLAPALVVAAPAPLVASEAHSFARDIAPIVARRCQGCHHERGAAPFALLTRADLAARLQTIRAVVATDRMPPWHAEGPPGRFVNDRRLTPGEKRALLAWIEGGALERDAIGEPRDGATSDAIRRPDLAAAPREAEGGPVKGGSPAAGALPELAAAATGRWRIGEPDVVFELPEAVEIPPDGELPYRYYSVATGFDEDVWVAAAEAQPGNPRVVHHMIVDFHDPRAGIAARGGPGSDPRTAGSLGSYVPGDDPLLLPPGVARRVPAGAVLVFQMHYTPTGRPERDRSRIGLVFAPAAPRWESRTGLASNPFIHIPAGAAAHTLTAAHDFTEDVLLDAMTPHMHRRGKSFEYRALFPDGRRELLLRVPDWDFDWQTTYRLAAPVFLPAGTRLECIAIYDNSAANPSNPDPTRSVSWGEQTSSEMMIGFFQYRPVAPLGPVRAP